MNDRRDAKGNLLNGEEKYKTVADSCQQRAELFDIEKMIIQYIGFLN